MDSSNSPLDVTAWSLRSSVHPEDKAAADECERILNDVVAKLKPILRYVCTPYEFFNMAGPGTKPRCLLVGTYNTQFSWDEGKPVHVFLNEQGKFFQAQKEAILMAKNDDHLVVLGSYDDHYKIAFTEGAKPDSGGYDPWTHLIFSELIGNLRKALAEAEKKREQHLSAVSSRREMLDRLVDALQSKRIPKELTPEEIMERFGRLSRLGTSVMCRTTFPSGQSKWYVSMDGVQIPVHTMDMSGPTPEEAIINAWRAITDPQKTLTLIRYFCKRKDEPIPGNGPQVWVRWNHETDDWVDVQIPDNEWHKAFASHASEIRPYAVHKIFEAHI